MTNTPVGLILINFPAMTYADIILDHYGRVEGYYQREDEGHYRF
jgi:hypothetical protein